MQRSARWWHRRSYLFLALLVAGAVIFLICRRTPAPAPFIVLRPPITMPVSWRDRLSKWIPANTIWLWRLEEAVFGRRKALLLRAEIVPLGGLTNATSFSSLLGSPSFSGPNGLQVWLLEADQLKTLREQIKQTGEDVRSARISTADGIESSLFQGESVSLGGSTNQVGFTFHSLARINPGVTDLITDITLSRLVTNTLVNRSDPPRIQTNLAVAFRLQLPNGHGVFLQEERPRDPGDLNVGVIIYPLQLK